MQVDITSIPNRVFVYVRTCVFVCVSACMFLCVSVYTYRRGPAY